MLEVRKNGEIYYKGKLLKPHFNQKWRVSYIDEKGKNQNASVDVLVAKEYLGYHKGQRIIHKNGDLKDCRVENLIVCERSQQLDMMYKLLRGEIK